MTDQVTSLSADALVERARECFALGLISSKTLDRVTRLSYTEPEYTAILDLPTSSRIEEERKLRREAARRERPSLLRRLIGVR